MASGKTVTRVEGPKGAPIAAVIVPGLDPNAELEAVSLEMKPGDYLEGVKIQSVMQALLKSPAVLMRLILMTYSERVQVLEAIRKLVAYTPEQFSKEIFRDRRIRIVEIPKHRFLEKKWRQFPLKLYGICYLSSDSDVPYPIAGMVFALAEGRDVLPCLSSSKVQASEVAKAACHYYADQPVLLILGLLRQIDCPPLIRMLTRARRVP